MTDYDYEATVEKDGVTLTFKGNSPKVVSAQAARMPVMMHGEQINRRVDMGTPVWKMLKYIEEQQEEMKRNAKPDHLD